MSCTGSAQDSTQTYPVHGVVLDSITHQPIARALVEEQSDAALTDSNGRFELQLPSQIVTITARRPGYDAQSDATRTLQVSASTPEVTFQLTPHAFITGHLELPDEADAAGIQVAAYRARMRHGVRTWEFAGAADARSDGSFRLVPPQIGIFILRTYPVAENNGQSGELADEGAKVFGYPSVSYPGVGQQSSEGGLRLGRGQQLNVNMVLTRQEFHPVVVSVRGVPDGMQPTLQLLGEDGVPLQLAVQWNAQNRQASARLPDGQYSMVAELNGQTPLSGRTDFQTAGAPLGGLSITILPLLPVAVNVHRDFVPGQSHVFDRVQDPAALPESAGYPAIGLILEPADGQSSGGSTLRSSPGSLDRSSLQLVGTEPGRYWVQVYAQEGYVSAVTSGGVDLEREPLVVGPGGASQPIEVTVRNDPGQIGCTVRTNATQAAAVAAGGPSVAFVYAIPQLQTTQMPPQIGAPLNVEALMTPVPPGTYRVIALDQSINIDEVDKQDMERYSSKGQTVTVEAGGKATVSLSISHVNDATNNTDVDDSVPE